jgi:hypothetical protein
VIIARADGVCVALVHLRMGSIRVRPGERVAVGSPLAECGNSGNSTEPHVHLQATDHAEMASARGLPFVFRHFRERSRGTGWMERELTVPAEGSLVESV